MLTRFFDIFGLVYLIVVDFFVLLTLSFTLGIGALVAGVLILWGVWFFAWWAHQ